MYVVTLDRDVYGVYEARQMAIDVAEDLADTASTGAADTTSTLREMCCGDSTAPQGTP